MVSVRLVGSLLGDGGGRGCLTDDTQQLCVPSPLARTLSVSPNAHLSCCHHVRLVCFLSLCFLFVCVWVGFFCLLGGGLFTSTSSHRHGSVAANGKQPSCAQVVEGRRVCRILTLYQFGVGIRQAAAQLVGVGGFCLLSDRANFSYHQI